MLGAVFQCALYEHAQHDITRTQLLLRWPRNVAQIEFSLLSGIPLFNALFLINLCEYRHKTYI